MIKIILKTILKVISTLFLSLLGVIGLIANLIPEDIISNIVPEKDKASTSIISRVEYRDYYIEKVYDNYIVAMKKGKIGVIDYDGKEIIPFKYDELEEAYSDIIELKNGKFYDVYNSKGKALAANQKYDSVIEDEIDDKRYYLNNGSLYDINSKMIINNAPYGVAIFGSFVETDNYLLNINDGKKYSNYAFAGEYGSYLLLTHRYNDNAFLYDKNKKTIKQYRYTGATMDNILYDSSGKKYYLDYGTNDLGSNKTYKLNDVITVKRNNNTCQIINKNNEVITNQCIRSLSHSKDNKVYYIYVDDGSYVVFKDGSYQKLDKNELAEPFETYLKYGRSIFTHDKVIETECYYELENGVCNNSISKIRLGDDFKTTGDYYDDLECLGDYCSGRNNNIYYLIYKDKVIYEGNDRKFFLLKDRIIADTIDGIIIYQLGEGKAITDEEFKKRIDVDYSSVLPKLEDLGYEDLGDGNNEEYYKYAYYVIDNEQTKEIRYYFYELFTMVNENLEFLDEYHFYRQLSILKVVFNRQELLKDRAVGLYEAASEKISYAYDEETMITHEYALPHEIVHFFDWDFCLQDSYIFSDNKIISAQDFNSLTLAEKEEIRQNKDFVESTVKGWVIVEGGAEYNAAKYTFGGDYSTYKFSTNLYAALSYVLGYDVVNKAFIYSDDSKYMLYQNGLSLKEVNDFNELVIKQNATSYLVTVIPDSFMSYMIKMYENNKKGNWEEDRQFLLIMKPFLDKYKSNSNYNYQTASNNLDILLDSLEYKGYYFGFRSDIINTIVSKDDIYTIIDLESKDEDAFDVMRVEVRIKNNKITYKEVDY